MPGTLADAVRSGELVLTYIPPELAEPEIPEPTPAEVYAQALEDLRMQIGLATSVPWSYVKYVYNTGRAANVRVVQILADIQTVEEETQR